MSTDLALVGVGPDIVGMVDDLGREPEQTSLDRFQGGQSLRSETALVGWRGHQRTGGPFDRCAHLRGLLGSRGGDSYASMVIQGLSLTLRGRGVEGTRGAAVSVLARRHTPQG